MNRKRKGKLGLWMSWLSMVSRVVRGAVAAVVQGAMVSMLFNLVFDRSRMCAGVV